MILADTILKISYDFNYKKNKEYDQWKKLIKNLKLKRFSSFKNNNENLFKTSQIDINILSTMTM